MNNGENALPPISYLMVGGANGPTRPYPWIQCASTAPPRPLHWIDGAAPPSHPYHSTKFGATSQPSTWHWMKVAVTPLLGHPLTPVYIRRAAFCPRHYVEPLQLLVGPHPLKSLYTPFYWGLRIAVPILWLIVLILGIDFVTGVVYAVLSGFILTFESVWVFSWLVGSRRSLSRALLSFGVDTTLGCIVSYECWYFALVT